MASKDKRFKTPTHPGRPRKLTPVQLSAIVQYLNTNYSTLTTAAKETGVPYKTLWETIQRDKTFAQQIAQARINQADLVESHLNDLERQMHEEVHACEDPRRGNAIASIWRERLATARWIASKRYPKKYGELQRMALEDSEGRPAQIVFSIPRPNVSINTDSSPKSNNSTDSKPVSE